MPEVPPPWGYFSVHIAGRFLYACAADAHADSQGTWTMGPNGAPIAVVTRADVYRHHPDCLKTDLFSTSEAASGAVGRPRLGEFDVVSTIGASRTIPVVDPTHWEATRATSRSRLFRRRTRHAFYGCHA